MGWCPGVFDLEPFDFTQQLPRWGAELLNHEAIVTTFEQANFPEGHERMFIRPCNDSKYFAGRVFEREEFKEWQHQVVDLKLDFGTSLSGDTLVQLCHRKVILQEYRFWVVKGKLVTSSGYKQGDRVLYWSDVDPAVTDYARKMVDMWQPLEAFVLDVAVTDEGMKIVEINTINSAGFYAADVQRLVFALEEGFG